MKRRWIIWIKKVGGSIDMLSCPWKTHLMNAKFIVDFFENERGVKDMVDILVFFLQVAKKENSYIFL